MKELKLKFKKLVVGLIFDDLALKIMLTLLFLIILNLYFYASDTSKILRDYLTSADQEEIVKVSGVSYTPFRQRLAQESQRYFVPSIISGKRFLLLKYLKCLGPVFLSYIVS